MAWAATRRAALFFALWLVLSGAEAEGLAAGLAASATAAWASLRLSPDPARLRPGPLLRLISGFLLRSLEGGWDVAWRALHPRMPLRPGWIAYPTRLPRGGSRVALGGELSLQPGSLAAGSRGGRLLVHVLDVGRWREWRIARDERRLQEAVRPPGDRR